MINYTEVFIIVSCAVASIRTMLHLEKTSGLQQFSSKRGAAYSDASLVDALANNKAGVLSWSYNWDSKANGEVPLDLEYVPMLWGTKSFGDWGAAVDKALTSGSSHILGFNEPDMSSQADMSPLDAAKFYKEFITPYAARAQLISPAITSSISSGQGLDWFESFIGECKDCSVSGLAIHWYGNSADELKYFVSDAIKKASAQGISEVWLTEFALKADANGVSDEFTTSKFLEDVLPWLDARSELTRYAYFYCADGHLLSNNTTNRIGEVYISRSLLP